MPTLKQIARSIALAVAVLSCAGVQPADADALYVSNFGNNTIPSYDLATGAFLSAVVTRENMKFVFDQVIGKYGRNFTRLYE